jgi:hypothetical protein
VCTSDYVFNDLDENPTELIFVKSWRAKTVLAIAKNGQPPAVIFNGRHVKHSYMQIQKYTHHFRERLVRIEAEYDVEFRLFENFAEFLA